MSDLEQIIAQLGVHPALGDVAGGWGIEQNPYELAEFLDAITSATIVISYDDHSVRITEPGKDISGIATVLELGTGYRAGLARFMTETLGLEVTSIDQNRPQTPAAHARFIHATTHDAYPQVAGQKFDLVLIDADHAYDAVAYDYSLYAPLASKVVALHDICGLRDCEGVALFWHELAYTKAGKLRKGFHEAIADGDQRAGIGWHYVAGGVE